MFMLTFEQKQSYFAAFVDSEGWVTFRRLTGRRENHLQRQIGFTNTNKPLFDRLMEMAKDLGLDFAVDVPRMKNVRHSQRYNARLLGGRAAYEKFHALVPLQHPEKVERLEGILASYLSNDMVKRKRAEAWRQSMSYERQCEIADRMVKARMAVRNAKRIASTEADNGGARTRLET
jgi:hypothetical protein